MRRMRIFAAGTALVMSLGVVAPVSASPGDCSSGYYAWNSIELAPGFWQAGTHTLTYETAIGPISGELLVADGLPTVPGQVVATIYPLDGVNWYVFWLGIEGPIFGAIGTAQDTDIMDLWWFPDRQTATLQWADPTSLTTVRIDGGASLSMKHSPIVSSCMGGMGKLTSTGAFHRSFGPKYGR